MPRSPRCFRPDHAYHVTVRCNNRAFDLRRREARAIVLFAIRRAMTRFGCRLYGLAIMSNHVHSLVETPDPADLSRFMQCVNWNVAMRMNRLLGRTGHFWEARYHAVPVPNHDQRHVLTVLRSIHGNPMAAGVRRGFRDPYTNYGSYVDRRDDGLTSWHPQFLRLGRSLEECAHRYRRFCTRYRPLKKARGTSSTWGRRILAGVRSELERQRYFGQRRTNHHTTTTTSPTEPVQASLFDPTSPEPGERTPQGRKVPRRTRWASRDPVPGTPHARHLKPWLDDPIRACFRRFVMVNSAGRG